MKSTRTCLCGCGQITNMRNGKENMYIHGHNSVGTNNNNFKGGIFFQKARGRWCIDCRDGSMHYYARAVMESHLKRELPPNEVVHHINGDKTDDRIENLQLMEFGEHTTYHHSKSNGYKAPTKHSDKELISALVDFYYINGRFPSTREYARSTKTPCAQTIRIRFGGWGNAVKMARLEVS